MSRFSLQGRNAVVTGGSRGIGRAIALGLADAGANVALTYRERADEADTVVRAIKEMGRNAVALRMDVADRASVEAAAVLLTEASGAPARLTAPASGLFLERVYYEGDSRAVPVQAASLVPSI